MHPSRITTVTAIILKRKNVGEADKILTVFSKNAGKLRVIAKGIRKITSRRGPHLDIFNEVRMTIHKGGAWDTLSEVAPVVARRATLDGWKQMRAAYVIVEVVDKLLPEAQPNQQVYEYMQQAFNDLERAQDADVTPLLITFLSRCLVVLGYAPEDKQYSDFSEIMTYIEQISERKIRSMRFFEA